MKKVYTSVLDLIGHTPILELTGIEKKFSLQAKLYAKIERNNPAGSVKDRIARQMVLDAEAKGTLKPGSVIIEPTSGNTGIGLASVCASKGYRLIIVMPDSMSIERRKLMRAYGAELVLTEGSKGMKGAIEKANELHAEIPNSMIAGQFENASNPKAHYLTTAPEIYDDMEGDIACFVAGVGTGGTVTGIGKYLKEKNTNIKVVAVEPKTSAVLSTGVPGKHGIQGIGAGFVPKILDTKIYDEIIAVEDKDAFETAKLVGKTEGILCGISSGASLYASICLAKREEFYGKNIVVLFPDGGDRYLSTALFDE